MFSACTNELCFCFSSLHPQIITTDIYIFIAWKIHWPLAPSLTSQPQCIVLYSLFQWSLPSDISAATAKIMSAVSEFSHNTRLCLGALLIMIFVTLIHLFTSLTSVVNLETLKNEQIGFRRRKCTHVHFTWCVHTQQSCCFVFFL